MEKLRFPCLGAAYYPEDWPESELEKDLDRMKEIGIRVIRIGEFAWHRMEPEEGRIDLSFFRRVIGAAKERGIFTIFGTPTATPPHWLTRSDPGMLRLNENGRRTEHGGRRHCCSNSEHYREACRRIVTALAREFADEEGIIGWQIDNEIYTGDGGCFCDTCVSRFRTYLREKYGTVDELNRQWELNLFSQWYDSFEEIPAPSDAWHNPHLRMEWSIFQNESHIDFVRMQAEILHRYVHVPVGTDTMPFNRMDYRHMTEKLDIVQFNHYNTPENLYGETFWFDYLRTMKDRPFWNTETATCWNGSVSIGQSIKPEGFCVLNSWLPVALGAEMNLYWLWRTHHAGHELMHGSVIDTSGRDMLTTGEVIRTAEQMDRASEFVSGTKVCPDLAIHYTSLNENMHAAQPVVDGWDYMRTVQDRFYLPAIRMGLRPDVIDSAQDLDRYRVILSPMMMTLEENDLGRRIAEWVRNGGIWIAGPLTDVRDACGARYMDRYFGMLEELTGARWKYLAPDREGRIRAEWTDGSPFSADTWFEMFEPDRNAIARVTEGHSAIRGTSLVLSCPVGKGRVYLLGSVPSCEESERLIRLALRAAGREIPEVSGQVIVSPRKGPAGEGVILAEIGDREAVWTAREPMEDLLTGGSYSGPVPLRPYEVKVLRRTGSV